MSPTYTEGLPAEASFESVTRELRKRIKLIGVEVRALYDYPRSHEGPEMRAADVEELQSNIILAYRHLEDAAMRLGKAIQAFDGGVSVYDK